MSLDRLDLIVVGQEHTKKIHYKRIILVVGIIAIIICSIYLATHQNSNNGVYENVANVDEVEQTQQTNENVVVAVIDEPKFPMPVLSENAKMEISNIYTADARRVFLTFDDGPSNTITTQILDILNQNNIKATFFVLGSRVELYPDILKREYNEGHFIANHGYSHKYSSIYATPENVLNEYNQTELCIRNALEIPDYSSHLFRFPGGTPGGKYAGIKSQAVALLDANGIAHVDWNSLTRDSEGKFTKDELINNMIQTVGNKNNVILLMHDAGGKQTTADALQEIINYFRDNGYEFKNFYDIMK